MQGTQIAFDFHLSFQKMLEHKLLDSFSHWLNSFPDFCNLFPIGWMNMLEFSRKFCKKRLALYWLLKS